MDRGNQFERVGVLAVRVLLAVATLVGFYLVLEGLSLLHRLFGVVLVGVGLFLLYHHAVVYVRGAMEG